MVYADIGSSKEHDKTVIGPRGSKPGIEICKDEAVMGPGSVSFHKGKVRKLLPVLCAL